MPAFITSSSCPSLVERAMMPPSIVSEAYYVPSDVSPSPYIQPLELPTRPADPSLLTVKHGLHDEVARIFSNVSKPSLPPFTLPSYSLWDSPSTSAQSTTSRSFASNRITDSIGNSTSSRTSSLGIESFDSLLFSPSVAHTPLYPNDHVTFSVYNDRISGSVTLVGLDFTGVYKEDNTPFDGLGVLPRAVYAKGNIQEDQPHVHSGFGLGLYGEDSDCWQWVGQREILFDADGDTTLVDLKGFSHGTQASRNSDLFKRQSRFSPPGLVQDLFSPVLSNFSTQSPNHPAKLNIQTSGNAFLKTDITTNAFSRLLMKDMNIVTTYEQSLNTTSTKARRGLSQTLPLPPSTSDVFYNPSDSSLVDPPAMSTPADLSAKLRASNYFQLRKRDENTLVWTLPTVGVKSTKSML